MSNYTSNDFYCINCGNKGLPVQRNRGHQHKSFHREKLYCIYCKTEVNHIEVKNNFEAEKFKEEFERGAYIDEAKESLAACGHSRQW